MRALTYHGSKDVRVETVPDPVLRDAQLLAGSVPRHALREIQGYPLAVLEWQGGVWLRATPR